MESEGGRCEEAPGLERPPSLLLLGLSLRRRRRSSTTFSSLTLTAFVTLLLLLETLLVSETEAFEVEAVFFSEGVEEETGTASASLASSTGPDKFLEVKKEARASRSRYCIIQHGSRKKAVHTAPLPQYGVLY